MPTTAPKTESAPMQMFPTPGFDIDRVVETGQQAVAAAFEAQGQGLRQFGRIGASVLDFVERRLKHDAETAEAMRSARSAEQAYAIYRDFFDTAIQEYSAEFGALASLCAEQGRQAAEEAGRLAGRSDKKVLQAAE